MNRLLQEAYDRVDALYRVLEQKHMTVSTAESCTGGMIGACLTHPAGASRYYMGSIISYANEIKTALLGVPEATLRAVGAVSPETAEAMAIGAYHALGTSLTVAVTGIAGPGGESAEKPQRQKESLSRKSRGGSLTNDSYRLVDAHRQSKCILTYKKGTYYDDLGYRMRQMGCFHRLVS